MLGEAALRVKGLTLANAPAHCILPSCGVPLKQTPGAGPPKKYCTEAHERMAYMARMKAKRAARKAATKTDHLFGTPNPKRLTIKT